MFKVVNYNPGTGKGICRKVNGDKIRFSYRDFQNEKAIWPGYLARFPRGKITKAIPLSRIPWIIGKMFFDIKRYVS